MCIRDRCFTEKVEAGEAILAICKANQSLEPVPLGSYRGFKMELTFDSFQKAVSYTHLDVYKRQGLIAELQTMQKSLTVRDRNLRKWTASLLAKLAEMTDAEYEALDLYPDE